jgi:hypothetical protein
MAMKNRPNIDHPALGRLEYDGELDWYTGALPLGDRSIELRIHCEGADGEPPAMGFAVKIAARLDALRRSAEDFAVSELLALKNNTWLDDDQAEVSADEFKRLMTLDSVVVHADGSAAFYHSDGDLFWGHCILLRMGPDERFTVAEIAG